MKNFLIQDTASILATLKRLDIVSSKCLVVVNENKDLLGTVSGGDLRRAILEDANLDRSINNIFNKNPITLESKDDSHETLKNNFLKNKIDVIPIIDANKKVIDVVTFEDVFKEETNKRPLDASVIIMAGGKGTRMAPFTNVLPKPLIPIKEKTVIEHIISQFTDYSINDFFLTLNFKSGVIKAFFEELNPDYSLSYLEETIPLGTASSLQLIPDRVKNPFFVTNCDTLINIDLNDFYDFHMSGGYEITLVGSAIKYNIPYGTCVLNDVGDLKEISEKPSLNYLVNSGMYIVNPSALKLIPKEAHYDITTLIEDCIEGGNKVGVYPVKQDDWNDIGQWAEYKKVLEIFN